LQFVRYKEHVEAIDGIAGGDASNGVNGMINNIESLLLQI
jgi:hypothetical protein